MGSGPVISDEEFIARAIGRLRLRRFVIVGRPHDVGGKIVHGWSSKEIHAMDRVEDALTAVLKSFTS
jgi:hypothetical protein